MYGDAMAEHALSVVVIEILNMTILFQFQRAVQILKGMCNCYVKNVIGKNQLKLPESHQDAHFRLESN